MSKILIVDDDNFHRKLAGDMLKEAGYSVVEAEDGEKGIAAAIEEKPDLILMDIAMPGIDGIETCRRIKEIEDLVDTPVVMYTSLGEDALVDVAKKSGAVDYVIKPPKKAYLLSRVDLNLNLKNEQACHKKYELTLAEKDAELKKAYEEIEMLRSKLSGLG